MECPICIEPIYPTTVLHCPSSILTLNLSCCSQFLCQTCLYNHIQSILTEGITGGKRPLTCPFGCGRDLLDTTIRQSIRYQHWTYLHGLLGCWIVSLLNRVLVTYDRYYYWMNWTKSSQERKDLRLYETWSLTQALSYTKNQEDSGDANSHYQDVLHCPRPNCDCQWLANTTFRQQKQMNEEPYHTTRMPLFSTLSAQLFYSPLSPQVEEEILLKNGYTTEHWVSSEDIPTDPKINTNTSILKRQLNRDGGHQDGRRITCPQCLLSFCGLCLRPWSTISQETSQRIYHAQYPCGVYERLSKEENDEYTLVADGVDARSCPRCSMRICRSRGCNHMTCVCGMEWCYICEREWHVDHNGCRDDGQIKSRSGVYLNPMECCMM